MKKPVFCFFLLFFINTFQMLAQTGFAEYESKYNKAKGFFDNGDFERARGEFNLLGNTRYDNALVPFSIYFKGLSLLKLNKNTEAGHALKSLLYRFPNWEKTDEVKYLLVYISFEDKNYADAFSYAKEIKDEDVLNDLDELKSGYINQISDMNVLSELNNKFSDEKISKRIKSLSSIPEVDNPSKWTKGYFNIGALLPIDIKNLDPDKVHRNNQYALDMYQGMKLAKQKLGSEGVTVNLFVYDMANDSDEMLNLINNAPFQQMDVLFGPLHTETNKIATIYSEENKVPIINPLTNNAQLIYKVPYAFLSQPSNVTQGIKAAQFAGSHAFSGRSVAIYYTSSPNDSITATTYRQQIEKSGFTIVDFKKVPATLESISAALQNVADKAIGHIFLASEEKRAGNAMLSAMDKNGINVSLFSTIEAFNKTNLSAGMMNNREIYCIDPEFIDTEKPEVDSFRKTYMARYGVIPSFYAHIGYDSILFWGRIFGQYGAKFRKGLDSQPYVDNFTLYGFDYQKTNDNQNVPITTFQNYKFVPAR